MRTAGFAALIAAVTAAVLTGFLPVLVTKLILRMYPRAHPRRQEHYAELFKVPFVERLPWVFQLLALGLTEGLPARWRSWRADLDERGVRPVSDVGTRTLDIVSSAVLIVVLAPVFMMLAAAIKISDQGPVFYKQERGGRGGRRFKVVKFRTMAAVDADRQLTELAYLNRREGVPAAVAKRYEPRVTRLGRLLRRTSLDELPQLFNVLVGQMSLVGPRPTLPAELTLFGDGQPREDDRVRPGMIEPWQLEAFDSLDTYRRLNLEWIRARSIRLYLRILVRAIARVLRTRR